tara:strand:+ start:127 stop:846 length:720 start_codon:yes stop_codon:yes gene_type:complete
MKIYGLIGKQLTHSFSKAYFKKKFEKEKITDAKYINFEISDINNIDYIVKKYKPSGLNITIPFKEAIIPKLDYLSQEAEQIGAVNTINFLNNKLIGHNTDVIGFKNSITPFLKKNDSALILGNGGSAKAVKFALRQLNVHYQTVNRNSKFDYTDLKEKDILKNRVIINTTPLGLYPKIYQHPIIPYNAINSNHLLYDLIYNPHETFFLKYGKNKNAQIKNGCEMLEIQAEKSWDIWFNK